MMATDKFRNLRYRLMENGSWPMKYMFKFISPNHDGKLDKIKALLPEGGTTTFKHTPDLKYVSVTCIAMMDSADEIIEVTEKADKIEGVIVL